MGLSSSKSKQTTTNRGTVTTTPTNPGWVTSPWQNYIGDVTGLFNSGSPSDIAPGTNDNLEAAYAGASDLAGPSGPASWLDRDIGAYMDPYIDQVVDTSLSGYDQDVAERRAQMEREAAGAGAFGGSRYGIAEGQFGADSARDRAALEAGLYSNAFGQAAALREADTAREQEGDVAGQRNLTLLAQLGELQANRDLQERMSPYAYQALRGDLLNQTPFELFRGQTSTEDSTSETITRTPGGMFGSLLGLGGSLLSSGLLGGMGGGK